MPEISKTIVMRNLPGFAEIEDKVRLYWSPNVAMSPEFDKAINDLSRSTFDITEAEAWELFEQYDDVEEDKCSEAVLDAYDNYNGVENSDDDALETFKARGIDFSDERGLPMLCTRFFKLQALLAMTGAKGKLPDVEAAGLRKMESVLEAEARKFAEQKRTR